SRHHPDWIFKNIHNFICKVEHYFRTLRGMREEQRSDFRDQKETKTMSVRRTTTCCASGAALPRMGGIDAQRQNAWHGGHCGHAGNISREICIFSRVPQSATWHSGTEISGRKSGETMRCEKKRGEPGGPVGEH